MPKLESLAAGFRSVLIAVATMAVAVPTANAGDPNYQGLWWKSVESGWGVNFAHQGDQIFATWYTYDVDGNAYWLSMLADRATPTSNVYGGTINSNVGSPFDHYTVNAPAVPVGVGTLDFRDVDSGTFEYDITSAGGASNVHQTKAITRFSFGGRQTVCTYAAAPDLAAATNYQDLWWDPAESGWGVNFAHEGDTLFATWYTYDARNASNNPPMWLAAYMVRVGTSNVFTTGTGTGSGRIIALFRTFGPHYDGYSTSDETVKAVGNVTVTFVDGNHATFAYSTEGTYGLPGVSQSKSITRYVFAAPAGTVCQ